MLAIESSLTGIGNAVAALDELEVNQVHHAICPERGPKRVRDKLGTPRAKGLDVYFDLDLRRIFRNRNDQRGRQREECLL